MTLAVNIAQSGSNNVTFRNKLINGNMVIDQRNAGASVTPGAGVTYTVDRWSFYTNTASKLSLQQSTNAPAGFYNSMLITSLSAYSSAAGDRFLFSQTIEGFNQSDLGWGTANAQTATLSFWVKSSLTGTFSGDINNSAGTYSYVFTYSIPVANTWTNISLTIVGQQSGAWNNGTNGAGIIVCFNLGSGSTFQTSTVNAWQNAFYEAATGQQSLVGTNGATWQVTGVQLEAGTTASPFEYRSYGTEYVLCQRYYETGSGYFNGLNPSFGNNNPIGPISGTNFQVTKRATPAITLGTATTTLCYTNSGSTNNITTQSFAQTVLVLTGGATSGMVITQPWIAAIEL
jgi:hypothetical protein